MVKNKKSFVAILLFCFLLLVIFYPTEKRKIKRVLKKTAEWVKKEGEENPLVFGLRAKNAEKLFQKKVQFKYKRYNLEREVSIDEIQKGYLMLMQSTKKFNIKFKDLKIDILDNENSTCDATLLLESDSTSFGDLSKVQEIFFTFNKSDEGWKISGVEVVEVFEK